MPERVTKLKVKIAGSDIADEQVNTVVVDQDIDQPDMAMIILKNDRPRENSNKFNQKDPVEVTVEDGSAKLFVGEVVGIEPMFEVGGESKVVIRAFNRLHRLLRGRKSRTFTGKSDQDIASTIAQDHELTAESDDDPKITHDYVYQHNQTDFEFLRLRANRIGFDVLVEDTKLKFKKHDPSKDASMDPGIELKYDDSSAEYQLQRFLPRLSSAEMVQKVIVRGWNPDKKEEITGEAEPEESKMGSELGTAQAQPFGDAIIYTVDQPIFTEEEAKAIAKARLGELMLNYITGEGQALGHPKLKAGIVVKVNVNPDKADDRFNGKYLIVGTTHRYSHAGGGGSGAGGAGAGGYVTLLRVRRDAQKPAS